MSPLAEVAFEMCVRNSVLIVGLLLLASPAPAQTGRKALWVIPKDSVLRCRVLPAREEETGWAANHLEFAIGNGPVAMERTLEVSYDSSGNPLSFSEVVTYPGGIAGAAAKFHPNGDIVGLRTDGDVASLSTLTVEEHQLARELSKWLWVHRCGRRSLDEKLPQSQGG